MADENRVKKLKKQNSHLEEQLKKSEKLMDEFKKKVKARSQTSPSKGKKAPDKPAGKADQNLEELVKANRELEKRLETQRQEFEVLVGRLSKEIKAAKGERDELVRLLRFTQKAIADKGESFEDEPTATYARDMEGVIEKEKGVAAQFADEEATASFSMDEMLAKKAKDEEEDR